MGNVFNLKWIVNIAITVQKTGFLKKKKLKKFSAEDRTGDLKVMSSLTRPLHQKNLLEIRAKNNALLSAHAFQAITAVNPEQWEFQMFKFSKV